MQISPRAFLIAFALLRAIVLGTGYVTSRLALPFPKPAVTANSNVSETGVERILRKANAMAREAAKDSEQAEPTQSYSKQLELAVKNEQDAYDLISQDVARSSDRLKELKTKLDEQVLLNKSPELIESLNQEFETLAQLLIDKQVELNEAYKKLQTAQDKAVSNIISQKH